MMDSPGATMDKTWPPSDGLTNGGTIPTVNSPTGIVVPKGIATFWPAKFSPASVVATDHLSPFGVPSLLTEMYVDRRSAPSLPGIRSTPCSSD